MSVHKDERGYWRVHWRDDIGKQKVRSFGKGKDARLKAYEFESNRSKQSSSNMTMEQLLPTFLAYLRLKGNSKRYMDGISWVVEKSGLKDVPIRKLKLIHFEPMVEGKSTITRNRYLSYLKILFNYGVDNDFVEANPLKKWKKAKELPRQSRLTIEDLERIRDNSAEHLQWAIEVAFNLGVRSGRELFMLRWSNVLWDENLIRVYASKTHTYRYLPISDEFKQSLERRLPEATTDHIVEYQGKALKRFHKSWRTACLNADIQYKCVFYDIRHLFATTLLSNGADLKSVSELLGHSSTKMTADVYYHALEREKRRAVTLLPKLGGSELPTHRPGKEQKKPDPLTCKSVVTKVVTFDKKGDFSLGDPLTNLAFLPVENTNESPVCGNRVVTEHRG